MNEYLNYVCAKLAVTPYEVFKAAYRFHYKCEGWVIDDVLTHLHTGELPIYVELYLEDIRDKPFLS